MGGAGLAVAQRHGAALQHIACGKAGLHGRKAAGFKALQHGHQRWHDAQQGGGGVQARLHVLQAAGGHAHAFAAAGQHIDANAHHHVAGGGAMGGGRVRGLGRHKAGGLHQNAAQLAVAAQPQVIGPFQANARRLARLQRGQGGLQALGHAHPHGQRQARPVPGRHGQAQRQHEGSPHVALPHAAQAAAPGGLLLGHQQGGLGLPGTGAAHQLGVGRIDAGQHFHREARQQRGHGLPDGLGRPADGGGHALRPFLASVALPVFGALALAVRGSGAGRSGMGGRQPRLGASSVPRQVAAPHQQGYSAFSLGV